MRQKDNLKGFINVHVPLLLIKQVKTKVMADGRTLQWAVEQALIQWLEPKEGASVVDEPLEEKAVDKPKKLASCPACGGNKKLWNDNTDSWEVCDRCRGEGKI